MFNFVSGNPFNKKIESALSTGQENKRHNQDNRKEDETNYLEQDDNDEVKIGQRPELSEEDIVYLTNEYIKKLKNEYEDNTKIIQKLDKYLVKFDVKKFMKQNPHITAGDFNMIMYNETSELIR